ncbi:hypothetical protein [Thermocoleostomius sinensis]|jgi:hypothetical protein|uniref:Uncharacterized protein n=1 Tax=Thermocoleostomius sinensis A174 TaxID=2016057 RepID=A0A9E8ZHL9_9CYAN|nr:hypothetical protein [Thermocoleostomius sinensis]WAL58676.1 hypothetical protein OXH18_16020 [Thermocoleostomius sinensis A174]
MGKNSRFWLLVILCGVSGSVLGATTSQAAINECLTDATPSTECLTQNPMEKKVEGISMGLMAGVSAAIGASWRIWQK